jgi:hypothetical protein
VLRTPRGTATFTAPGRYEVVAGDTEHPTMVTVVEGAAQVSGTDFTLSAGPHQTVTLAGEGPFQGSAGPEVADAFLSAQLAQERPPRAMAYAPPPVVQNMTGADALYSVGEWAPSAEYGEVWYPPVAAGWVPYRHGHWAYVAPWGWTWVDDAPWGFAPFHYGRWVQLGGRWCWTPVVPGAPVVVRPVYAPALVSFVDPTGVAVGAAVGLAAGVAIGAAVGWIPLGPREPYYPPYHVSRTYIRNVNVTNVTNIANITKNTYNNTTVNHFVNHAAATVAPAAAMTGSRPIAQAARPLPPRALANARPLTQPPVHPTAATAGITPSVARQVGIAAHGGAEAAHAHAPGPVVAPPHPANAAAPLTLRPVHPAPPATTFGGQPGHEAVAGGTAPGPRQAGATPAVPGTPTGQANSPAHPAAPGPAFTPRNATAPVLRTPGGAPAGQAPGSHAPGAIGVPQNAGPGTAAHMPAPHTVPESVTASRPTTPPVHQSVVPPTQHFVAPQEHQATPVPAPHYAAPHNATPPVQHAAPASPAPHFAPQPERHAPPPERKPCPPGHATC